MCVYMITVYIYVCVCNCLLKLTHTHTVREGETADVPVCVHDDSCESKFILKP